MNTRVQNTSAPVSYSYYRRMKKHPTLALARRLSIAPLLRASWSIEGPDALDATVALAQRTIRALRGVYMGHVVRSLYDYGSAGMELYLDPAGELVCKPLLVDLISVMADTAGDFAGLQVRSDIIGVYVPAVYLEPDACIFLGLDSEAGQHYGTGSLEIARDTYASWKECDIGAKRYDKKIAGTFLQLTYFSGERPDADGNMVDNSVLAEQFLAAFEASGAVAVPRDRAGFLADAKGQLPADFELSFIGDTPKQGAFVERQKYLDALLVRSFGLPERSVLEGQFGTKADAEAHTNLALAAMEATHEFLTAEFERQALRPFLALVCDQQAADSVSLTAGPINPEHLLWKRGLIEKVLANRPEAMDMDALMDETGLPKSEVVVPTATSMESDNGKEN